MPGAAAIEQAHAFMTRLIASGTVVPLNLLGTVTEQPDFLAHSEALPYVLALRADANWKQAPQKSSGHKVSPLVLELWKVLDKDGGLTAADARETLGRELTEAAVLRALCELWQALRISPVPAEEGQPARWEMLRVRHRAALETGSTVSQVTALSLLVSMYLQSVYAATSEEIEIFLSPVASRSRVREAVRGLSATRQIHTLSMDAQTYYFLENGLPEFAETVVQVVAAETEASPQSFTAQRPRPRKVQATAGRDAASAPIFRRPKVEVGPQARPDPETRARPAQRPLPKPAAAQPASSAGWKSPARPGSSGKPAWKPAARPPAGGARWGGKDKAMAGGGKPRPAAGSRPPLVPGRSAARPYVRPGAAAPDTRSATRPESRTAARPQARDGARPNTRPGAWSGAGKREQPKPWALPGRKSSSAPRPPRPGGRRDAPFRPPQKYPAPPNNRAAAGSANPASGRESGTPFPPRAPRGERGPGDPGRVRSTPGRPQERAAGRTPRPPSAYGTNRSSAPYRAAQGNSGERRSGPPARGGRPSGPRPAGLDGPRSGPPKFDKPRSAGPRSAGPRSSGSRSGSAGSSASRFDKPRRPFLRAAGSAGPRPPSPGGADRGADTKPNARAPRSDRPRPAGYARPGGKPASGGGDKGRGDRGPRPPFVPGARPGSRPAKSWSRTGGASAKSGAKSGKPSAGFRGRKPDRKKPGA
jgi:23S rRNA pseudouridine2605 synthase